MLGLIRTALPTALIALMFAQGLLTVPGELLAFFRSRPWLILRSLAAVRVLVPAAGLAIILLLTPSPAVGVGLAVLASSPAAPFQLMNIVKRGGSRVYLATMHLSLALLALITVPATLDLFSTALGFRADISLLALSEMVGLLILLPVCAGLLVRMYLPTVAGRIGPRIGKVAELVVYVLLIPVLVMTSATVLEIPPWSYFVMAVFILVNLAIGHLLGPNDPSERTTLAMETGARNIGLALTIGALNFSQQKALAVLVPYIFLFVIMSTVYLKWRANQTAA
jgi:BASS family bile acid:Na+ symporter